jgi:hypothetical protein
MKQPHFLGVAATYSKVSTYYALAVLQVDLIPAVLPFLSVHLFLPFVINLFCCSCIAFIAITPIRYPDYVMSSH